MNKAGNKKRKSHMIKIISMWKRNPDITDEACEAHYRGNHTALAIKALTNAPGFRKYIQNKVVSQTICNFNDASNIEQVAPDFDRVVELYFDNRESFERAMATPEMQACFEDHPNFMNIGIPKNLVIWEVLEEIPLEEKE
jgi:uncharacterized protein (TIGR02118 family)